MGEAWFIVLSWSPSPAAPSAEHGKDDDDDDDDDDDRSIPKRT